MNSSPFALAAGSAAAVGGGIVAQTPNANVGTVGIIVAVGGLVTALLGGAGQIMKTWADARGMEERFRELKAQSEATQADLKKTREDLEASRERRHEDANRFSAALLEARVELMELKTRLGATAQTHGSAINANSDNIKKLAAEVAVELPAPAPHVG